MLYLDCRVLFCVQTALISVTFIGDVLPRYVGDEYSTTKAHMTVMPWVGILKYKQDENEFATGMILIGSKLAIANAKDVSKINKDTIRVTTKAMFLAPDNQAWYCMLIKYTLHPEFDEDTLNTLALIYLEYEDDAFKGDMLDWPSSMSAYSNTDVFAVGITERDQISEQVIHRMEHVNLTDCVDFYMDEELDLRWMRPSHYICYRGMFSKKPCVYDNGMALAANVSGKWTLLGMSTWGPGCALPARFINFASFVPWVISKIATRREDRKQEDDEKVLLKKNDYIYTVEKISENTVVLRPELRYLLEARGSCGAEQVQDEFLMYHEEAKYKVPEFGYGIYTFSIFDYDFKWDWTCIMIEAGSGIYYKSQAQIWSSEGFGKGLVEDEKLKKFIKIYPLFGQTRKPKVLQHLDFWERYEKVDIRNIHFRFDFFEEAKVKIMFYSARNYQARAGRVDKTRSYKSANATYQRRPHTWNFFAIYTTRPRPTTTTPPYGIDFTGPGK